MGRTSIEPAGSRPLSAIAPVRHSKRSIGRTVSIYNYHSQYYKDTTRALLRAHARGDVSDTELRRISNALDEGGLTQAEVRRALNRLHRLVSDGAIENPRIRLGTDANFRDPYYTVRYADDFDRTDLVNGEVPDDFRPGDSTPGYDPPHDPQGLVIEGRTSSPQDWVRVHTPDNQVGTFLMNSEEFASVAAEAGETGLRRRFALPGEYSRVSRVEVPEGAQVRVSTVGRQADDLPGGGTQIELRRYPEELPGDWFNEPKDIDRYVSEHQ